MQTHKNKIDIIYIDPPYNTGNKNEFKYNDNWVDKNDSFKHSKWLSFMYKRLKLAKELLSDAGVIFISIDDNEVANLRLLMDEIFGEQQFIANIVWHARRGGGNDAKSIANDHEYVICYCNNNDKNKLIGKLKDENDFKFEDQHKEKRGKYNLQQFDRASLTYTPSLDYPIVTPDNNMIYPGHVNESEWKSRTLNKEKRNDWCWMMSIETYETAKNNNFIVFKKNNDKWNVRVKTYQFINYKNEKIERRLLLRSILTGIDPNTKDGNKDIKRLNIKKVFSYPKPVNLIKKFIVNFNDTNALVLDFFAGSGTTGQAVLELNQEDGGNRQFILCTNNENNIAQDICYPRIKTVVTGKRSDGTKYSDGIPFNVRYFKTDFVNMSKDIDVNRIEITYHCHELLQIKENCYDKVNTFSIHGKLSLYQNDEKILAIIFDRYDDEDDSKYIKILKKVQNNKELVIYRFSIDGNLDMDVSELKNTKLEEIPEEILKIYQQVYRENK